MKSLNLINQASLTTGKSFGGFSLATYLKGLDFNKQLNKLKDILKNTKSIWNLLSFNRIHLSIILMDEPVQIEFHKAFLPHERPRHRSFLELRNQPVHPSTKTKVSCDNTCLMHKRTLNTFRNSTNVSSSSFARMSVV